jgi:hypothetical protein
METKSWDIVYTYDSKRTHEINSEICLGLQLGRV